MAEQATHETNTALAKGIDEGKITQRVFDIVSALRGKGELTLPSDYNVGNALSSAWLKLQTVANKDGAPIIKNGKVDTSIVTLNSVANALQDYVIQGLNCSKNQNYFIVYDKVLTCQRSYFGDMLLAERVQPGIAFYYDVIYKDDKFTTSKIWTKSGGFVDTVSTHEKAFPRTGEIIGAYCGVVDTYSGDNLGMTLMDTARIKKSWSKSKTYKWSKPEKPSTHDEFPEEMMIRTVVRHRCKTIINSSNDRLLMEALARQDDEALEAEVNEEIETHANKETLALAQPAQEAAQETQSEVSESSTTEALAEPTEEQEKAPEPPKEAAAKKAEPGEKGLDF